MNEQQIRQIVQDEIQKDLFRFPKIPPHRHDGVDNLQVRSTDLVYPFPVNGTIDFNSAQTYTLNLTGFGGIPRSVTFYGGALNTTASPKVHAMVVGNAQLGINKQFQPATTTSVLLGNVAETIIQGSAAIITENAGNTILKNSQGHIVYVEYPSGTIVVQADVIAYSATSIQIKVITLASNWSISGLWIVT